MKSEYEAAAARLIERLRRPSTVAPRGPSTDAGQGNVVVINQPNNCTIILNGHELQRNKPAAS